MDLSFSNIPPKMSSSPDARVAIVTGAAQGIGKAIALRLAVDGYNVAISDLPSKSDQLHSVVFEIETKGQRAIAVSADVSIEQDIQNLIQTTLSQLNGFDLMVANAGVPHLGSILDSEIDN
ncbi:hypothetical protein VKT23_019552 [Stygiomarasmius scandens]|uniref:3-oxoacyl-[acyl-carrier-protein] reductase n=1 Tax=Marasmiellus scandens TaxID=2682957 RepID=A0ABR1IND5_9AGAR